MKIEQLILLIKHFSLADHEQFLRHLVKPAVNIMIGETPITRGASKFGGFPDVPKGFKWPEHEQGPYRFLGQINFAQIANSPPILPKSGLLSLFIADIGISEEEPAVSWGDSGYVIGFYFNQVADLVPLTPETQKQKETHIAFETTIDLPFHEELLKEWPLSEDQKEELFTNLRGDMDREGDYLLGYPQYQSLAYNPTPKGDWISLIALNSRDDLDWNWHDGDRLMIFIEPSKLQVADFSSLKSDAG